MPLYKKNTKVSLKLVFRLYEAPCMTLVPLKVNEGAIRFEGSAWHLHEGPIPRVWGVHEGPIKIFKFSISLQTPRYKPLWLLLVGIASGEVIQA